MRRCIVLYGMTCIIGQVLALREISVAFHGNELVYGATLAAWLVLFAAGSGLLGRLADRRRLGASAFAFALAGGGAMAPVIVLLARSARWVLAGRSGVTPSFGGVLLATLAVLAPLCLLLGFFFALACSIAARRQGAAAGAAAQVYVYEALGTFIGGVLFSCLLVHLLNGFHIALGVAAVNCLAGFSVWRHAERRGRAGWALLAAAAIFAAVLVSPLGTILDFVSQSVRFPGRVLRATSDTPYGRIDVASTRDQVEFYESGVLAATNHAGPAEEETAFVALLAHPAPRHVLLIGGGLTGALRKTLALAWLRVDYVEMDPTMVQMGRAYAAEEDRAALDSPRVRVFTNVDGRYFVKRARSRYDVIFSTVPNPTTGLINRFYTREFFREARNALSDNGVLAITLAGPPAYMNAAHRALAASVYRTLRESYRSVAVLPTDSGLIFLASPSARSDFPGTAAWPDRMARWQLRPEWLTPRALGEIASPVHVARVLSVLDGVRATRINTDLHPVAYYHALLLWADAFQVGGLRFLRHALRMDMWIVLIAITLTTGLLALVLTFLPRPLRTGLAATRVYAGMAGFVLELVLIFAFQSFYGFAYGQMAILFASFMIGAAVGAAVTGRLDLAPGEIRVLLLLQTALAVLAAATVPILAAIGRAGPAGAGFGAFAVIPLLNLCAGALVGSQYPVSVSAAASGARGEVAPGRLAAGLYAADLAGACMGAALGGGLLIPLLGLANTCWALAVLSAASLPLLLLCGRRRF